MCRIRWRNLPNDQKIVQHPHRSELLLNGRFGPWKVLDPGSHMERSHGREFLAMSGAPIKKLPASPPRSRPPRLLACHNYSSQSSGASSILLFKAAGTVIYASKIAPCPSLRPIAHGTFPIRWATSGVDFVQPSSRSPRSPQSEI